MDYNYIYHSIKTLSERGFATTNNEALKGIVEILKGLGVQFETVAIDNYYTNIKVLIDYEQKALLYAEKYGIIDYEVNGNIMTYIEVFGNEKYLCRVNLDEMVETRGIIEEN